MELCEIVFGDFIVKVCFVFMDFIGKVLMV